MTKVIIYNEACEVLNIEKILKDDVEIICYLKNDKEFFGEYINGCKVKEISNIKTILEEEEFDYIIINSRRSSIIYEKLKEFCVPVKNILDVAFFFNDYFNNFSKERLITCEETLNLNHDLIFLGRNYISDSYMKDIFHKYFNLSNIFSDMHYDYHLLYHLIKNNKIDKNTKVGIFTNYSILYENIDCIDDKSDYINNFEEIFNIHNREKSYSTYYSLCRENFKDNYYKVFKNGNLKEHISIDNCDLSQDSVEKIMYDTQIETLNYKEANLFAFKMNKNILGQIVKLTSDNNIKLFFVIPPVHNCYRTYVNKTLQKEFYMVINKVLNSDIFIFDYFDLNFNDEYFSSPNNLNINGCIEFLKILSYDIKNKFLDVKACNNL